MGGYNDNTFNNAGYTPTAVGTSAAALFAALATALPDTDVFVTSSQASTTPGTETINRSAAIAAAAAAAPNVNKYIDMTNVNPWITGSGKVGATAGNGNADLYIHNDGAHPSSAGHNYYAQRIAAEIKGYYLSR